MANPNLNEKNPASSISNTMQDATNTIRNVSDRLTRMDADEMMERTSETANEFYDQAGTWMRDNSRMLYMIGGFVAVGVVGYFLGRGFVGNRSSDIDNY